MTATVIDFASRRPVRTEPVITVTSWWRCKPWCDDACCYGETFTFPDGGVTVAPRRHSGITYTGRHTDPVGGDDVDLTVAVTATEYDDEGFVEPAVVTVNVGSFVVELTPAAAVHFARAVETAAELATATAVAR